MHNDGYICNTSSIIIELGQEFHNHGGGVECGGLIQVCKVKSDGAGASISDQDFCCPGAEVVQVLQVGTLKVL